MFKKIYSKLAHYSTHPWAVPLLALLSFLEAFILPFSPLVLLIPLCFATPLRSWRLAMIATLASVVGSVAGYVIGMYAMEWLEPYLVAWGYQHMLVTAKAWYLTWGLWCLFVASIFPIPYKIFAITAGALNVPFIKFVITSFVVRWLHFALIPLLVIFSKAFLERWWKRKVAVD